MRLWALVVAVVCSASCGPSLKRCTANAECGAGYHCEQEVCVVNADAGSGGGGGSGGSGGGSVGGGSGGSGGGNVGCVPPCPASAECAASVCRARYASLALSGPSRTAAPNAVLTAQLTLAAGRTAADPPTLALSAVTPDGGTALDVLMRVDAGMYVAAVVLPVEGSWAWTAAFADAGLTAMKTVVVDRTAPVLSGALLLAPPFRVDTPALTEVDVGAVGAFRRDERGKVNVTSSATDIAAVVVTLRSPDGGTVSFDAGTPCAAGGFCVDVEVDFALPVMNAYRETYAVSVRAVDDVGNASGVVDAGHAMVTRFKWSRALPMAGTFVVPAIDERGNLYVSAAGTRESYDPNGTLRSSVVLAQFGYPPMVGTASGDPSLWFLNPAASLVVSAAAPLGVPWAPPTMTNAAFPVLAITRTPADPTPRETGFTVVQDPSSRPVAYRLGAAAPDVVSASNVSHPSVGPVMAGGKLWVRDDDGIVPYVFGDGGTDTLVRTTPIVGYGDATEERLVATSTLLVRTGRNPDAGFPELLAFDLADGGQSSSSNAPAAAVVGDELFVPLIGANDTVFIVHDPAGTTPSVLCRGSLFVPGWVCAATGATFLGATLGEGGLVYIATSTGLEARRQTDLSLVWAAPAVQSPQLTTSIDCSRSSAGARLVGRPGVVYGQSAVAAFRLFATIVDSRGVDATAAWPMLRHDPRNTGNTATSLVPFSCP